MLFNLRCDVRELKDDAGLILTNETSMRLNKILAVATSLLTGVLVFTGGVTMPVGIAIVSIMYLIHRYYIKKEENKDLALKVRNEVIEIGKRVQEALEYQNFQWLLSPAPAT